MQLEHSFFDIYHIRHTLFIIWKILKWQISLFFMTSPFFLLSVQSQSDTDEEVSEF